MPIREGKLGHESTLLDGRVLQATYMIFHLKRWAGLRESDIMSVSYLVLFFWGVK